MSIKKKSIAIMLFIDAMINIYTLIRPSTKHIRFGDLNSNLISAECYSRIGLNVYKNSSQVGYCGEYLYGRYYLNFLNFIHVHQSQRILIGILSFIAMVVFSIWLIKLNKKPIDNLTILIMVVFLAPGNILLVERANLDITIIFLLVAASYLIYKKREILSLLPVVVATLFKFYTLPIIIIMFFFTSKKMNKAIYVLTFIILSIIIFKDIKLSENNIPSGTFLTFGLSSILKWTNLYLSKIGSYEISSASGLLVLFVCFIVAVGYFFKKSKNSNLFSLEGQPFYLFSIFFTTYLTCYLIGSSFDYRLFYLSISAWILLIFGKVSQNILSISILAIVLVTWCGTQFWINNSSFQNLNVLMQSVTDGFLFVLTAYGMAIYLRLMLNYFIQNKLKS